MAERHYPLTTKGDIFVADASGNLTKLTVGTNTHVLTADSGESIGVKWAAVTGGSGITRTVVLSSGNFTAGSTASTDYVYILTAAHTPTMPTAVGNTDRYTFKNRHSANITFSTTSSQTIDGGTLIIAPDEAVDLISDGSNWLVI